VSGREDTWIAGFVDWLGGVKGAVDAGAVAEYAAHLRRRGHLAAAYAYFRTFHRDVEATIRNRETPLAMPVLAIGGEGALGRVIPDQAQRYAGDVTGAVLPCGHWVAEENPELLLEHLLPFLASSAITGSRRQQPRYRLLAEPETVPGVGDTLAACLHSAVA
jgi:pimeloyl-ACP methyl ester carboxylesterase